MTTILTPDLIAAIVALLGAIAAWIKVQAATDAAHAAQQQVQTATLQLHTTNAVVQSHGEQLTALATATPGAAGALDQAAAAGAAAGVAAGIAAGTPTFGGLKG